MFNVHRWRSKKYVKQEVLITCASVPPLYIRIAPPPKKKTNFTKNIGYLHPAKFRYILYRDCSEVVACLRKKFKMSQPIRRKDGHFCWRIGPKNENLVDDYLLRAKFRQIPFTGCREVENILANQIPGWSSLLTGRPEKRCRRHWVLASCQVSSD